MTTNDFLRLQARVQDKDAFKNLDDFGDIGAAFLDFIAVSRLRRVISPSHPHYIFYQYKEGLITRPVNTTLFIEDENLFNSMFTRFMAFLTEIRTHKEKTADRAGAQEYLQKRELNHIVYTVQQSIGCIGDAFMLSNQARKRIGQLFETFIKLIVQEVGLTAESRTVRIPIPGFPGYEMPYALDVVFSQNQAVTTSRKSYIHPGKIVGSIKTTSKDRIDKIFLDKHLLSKLLQRDIPVVAIFLHDVQRAKKGNSIFGINSTFKSNHFLGYTVALQKLDGVYYVDPRPEMLNSARLREQIGDLQQFLTGDLWTLLNY